MKKLLNDKMKFSAVFLALLLLFGCKGRPAKDAESLAVKYTCPMHPQVVADEPGACPVCHMDLVPVHSNASHKKSDATLENLVKPPNQFVISQIRTVRPQEGVRTAGLQVPGIISYDTNNWNSVSGRVAGRIERLYVKYNYQYVQKGQKLMDIYSPDLASAQQELLYLRKDGDPALIEAAKNKLRILGASNEQINTVLRTGKVDYSFSFYSPYSGFVAEQRNSAANNESMTASGTVINQEGTNAEMDEMGSQSVSAPLQRPTPETNSPLKIREGQYIGRGEKLFDLINSNSVFAEFFAGSDQLKGLKKGTEVQITAAENASQTAFSKVNLIQPYYSEGAVSSLVRARINNSGMKWKIGQLIDVKTNAESEFGTWLPRTSVLQLGTQYISFVKKENSFVPVYVSVFDQRGDWVDIGKSLDKNTEVAVNAWFMVDSESFVKVNRL